MTSSNAIQYARLQVIAWSAAVPERGFNPHNNGEALTMMVQWLMTHDICLTVHYTAAEHQDRPQNSYKQH